MFLQMRYRWKNEDQIVIAETWDAVCRDKFRIMMSIGKKIYTDGKNEGKLLRPSWMEPPMFNIARKRWDSEDSMKEAILKAKARGVRFDEEGKVVEKASARHYGGALSTWEIALQMVSLIQFLYCILFIWSLYFLIYRLLHFVTFMFIAIRW